MILSYIPILAVDVVGSVGMIIFSSAAFIKARKLRRREPDNILFLYLVWICFGLTAFALSRSCGHIVKQVLILSGGNDIWVAISPYSGTINTVSFMLVGLITLFFNQSRDINTKLLTSRRALEDTHTQLVTLNQTLEQKVVERTERLTSSEHKCRRIFEQSLDTILVTDDQWHIREINPAGVSMTGYTRDQLVMANMSMADLFASNEAWQQVSRCIMEDEYLLNEETYFKTADGSRVFVIITGGIDYGAFGCAKTFHFIIKNINEKKEMEEQIAQADKLAALGELSAGIAHEINNPLGIILGYTQLMLKSADKNCPDFQDDLKTIEKHVKTCKTVVSDMLAFARKDALKTGRVDIGRVITDVVGFVHNHGQFRDIDIEVEIEPKTILNVSGSEQELRQVMINLLINAGHAVNKNGRIVIRARHRDGRVWIQVNDNGVGIPKENLSRIFNPFFTTKPVGKGTGLGLSVSYGIIQKHGGTIQVKSKEEVGTCFTIRLPAETTGENP